MDRCFCLTVHKSTLVVNEASIERLLNFPLSFFGIHTRHTMYWNLFETDIYIFKAWLNLQAFKILHVQIRKIFINSLSGFHSFAFLLFSLLYQCWKKFGDRSGANRHFQDFQHFWDFLCRKVWQKSSTATSALEGLEQILRQCWSEWELRRKFWKVQLALQY